MGTHGPRMDVRSHVCIVLVYSGAHAGGPNPVASESLSGSTTRLPRGNVVHYALRTTFGCATTAFEHRKLAQRW